MRLLNRCPKLTKVKFKLNDKYTCTQKWAVRLWELLLCAIHCNPLPKTIYFRTNYRNTFNEIERHYRETIDLEIDWSFISSYNHEGIGSVKELKLELDACVNEVPLGQGPLWSYLTDKVKIERLTIIDRNIKCDFNGRNKFKRYRHFLRGLKADCLKVKVFGFGNKLTEPDKEWLFTFKTLHIVAEICCTSFIDKMKIVQHHNVHLVIDNVYTFLNEFDVYARESLELSIKALPESIFKTLICPKLDNHDYGKKPINETVFVCDETLSEKWYQFMEKVMKALDRFEVYESVLYENIKTYESWELE